MMRPRIRLLLKIVAGLAVVYLVLSGALLAAMLQPPDAFGQVMARVPRPLFPVFAVLPFEPLWFYARGGNLQVGEAAPDFSLQSVDKKSRVQLSSFRGQKPVVLVFGSYT